MYQNRTRKNFELYKVFMYDILYQNDNIFIKIFELHQILVRQNVLTLLWYWYMKVLLCKTWFNLFFIIFLNFVDFICSYYMIILWVLLIEWLIFLLFSKMSLYSLWLIAATTILFTPFAFSCSLFSIKNEYILPTFTIENQVLLLCFQPVWKGPTLCQLITR